MYSCAYNWIALGVPGLQGPKGVDGDIGPNGRDGFNGIDGRKGMHDLLISMIINKHAEKLFLSAFQKKIINFE